LPGEHEYKAVLESNGTDGKDVLLEKHDFSEDLSGTDDPDDYITAIGYAFIQLNRAIDKEKQGMSVLPFEEEILLFVYLFGYGDACQGLYMPVSDAVEEICILNYLFQVHTSNIGEKVPGYNKKAFLDRDQCFIAQR
jgi:hypothetical protein